VKGLKGIKAIKVGVLCIHRYRVDPVGLLVDGRIIPEKPVTQTVSFLAFSASDPTSIFKLF